MDDNGRFGFDPEDLDRVIRDASEGLRDAFEGVGRFFTVPGDRSGWLSLFDDLARRNRARPETAATSLRLIRGRSALKHCSTSSPRASDSTKSGPSPRPAMPACLRIAPACAPLTVLRLRGHRTARRRYAYIRPHR